MNTYNNGNNVLLNSAVLSKATKKPMTQNSRESGICKNTLKLVKITTWRKGSLSISIFFCTSKKLRETNFKFLKCKNSCQNMLSNIEVLRQFVRNCKISKHLGMEILSYSQQTDRKGFKKHIFKYTSAF